MAMDLNDWIDHLEDLRDEHGGDIWVELASDGQTIAKQFVVAVEVDPGEFVVQIG